MLIVEACLSLYSGNIRGHSGNLQYKKMLRSIFSEIYGLLSLFKTLLKKLIIKKLGKSWSGTTRTSRCWTGRGFQLRTANCQFAWCSGHTTISPFYTDGKSNRRWCILSLWFNKKVLNKGFRTFCELIVARLNYNQNIFLLTIFLCFDIVISHSNNHDTMTYLW